MSLSQRVYFAIGTAVEEQMDIDWSVSDQAIQQQEKVTAARREAQLASAAGKPTAFVDSIDAGQAFAPTEGAGSASPAPIIQIAFDV